MAQAIGAGSWTVQLAGRGGSPVRLEVPFASLSRRKVLNNYGSVSIQLDMSGDARGICCEAFNSTEPWRDEVLLYRDDVLDFAGPIVSQTITPTGGQIQANDLFHWMDVRFFDEDFFASGDLADIFKRMFETGYDKDTSPNIDISTRQVGTKGVRRFEKEQFQRVADAMREIARTGVDFTVIGRRIVAGGAEVFMDDTALILHDDGVVTAEVSREGENFASDVAVFGGTSPAGAESDVPLVVATGRATSGVERYGLVQRSFTELTIKDGISADSNASARLDASQPAPVRVKATVGPKAAFGFADLVPGKRMDVRLAETTCVEVMDEMRLTDVNVSVDANGEKVDVSVVPLGESD